jgi:hypothetical protein
MRPVCRGQVTAARCRRMLHDPIADFRCALAGGFVAAAFFAASSWHAPPQRPHAAGEHGGLVALSRLEMAVTSCAGAKGLVNRTLFGRPLDGQSSPWVPVI